jgi:hypothetical protein
MKIDGIENVVCYSTDDLERLVKYHERQIKYLRSQIPHNEVRLGHEAILSHETELRNAYEDELDRRLVIREIIS